MVFTHLWCSFRQRRRTCQSTGTNTWLLSNISFQFNSAFCALPDSVQFDQGSETHSFRIREQLTTVPSDNRPPNKDGFIYGFSHFIRRRDPSSKRGYQQVYIQTHLRIQLLIFHSLKHSLVILTQLQFPAFFTHLASIVGPLYEQHGTPMLETACHNIATWYAFILPLILLFWLTNTMNRRDPSPGCTLELGFLGSVLRVEIPYSSDTQQDAETSFNEIYDPRSHVSPWDDMDSIYRLSPQSF